MPKILSVNAIENGTVIDHIPPGQAIIMVRLLKLANRDHCVTIGLNLKSRQNELKDLIKIEGYCLSEPERHYVALFAPQATINIINHFSVVDKQLVKRPDIIRGLFTCPNPRCVTRSETVTTKFNHQQYGEMIRLVCHYCEKSFCYSTIEAC